MSRFLRLVTLIALFALACGDGENDKNRSSEYRSLRSDSRHLELERGKEASRQSIQKQNEAQEQLESPPRARARARVPAAFHNYHTESAPAAGSVSRNMPVPSPADDTSTIMAFAWPPSTTAPTVVSGEPTRTPSGTPAVVSGEPTRTPSEISEELTTTDSIEDSTFSSAADADSLKSNPYADGCLRHELGEDYPRRICNSDDSDDTLCSASSRFNYEEIRVHNSDWDSSIFYAWIIQILLSERVEVPSTIESIGTAKGSASFYHPDNAMPYSGEPYPYEAVKEAHNIGDCRKNGDDGKPCVHVLPEVWSKERDNWIAAMDEGYVDGDAGNGMVGKVSWYVPRVLADRDPTLVSYYGMKGKNHRKKLAETFGRPTTWLQWCRDISNSKCGATDGNNYDGTAQRWPKNGTSEETSYFSEGLFTGHFRFTEENDCVLNPDTCTGHVVDPPCSWGSYTASQTYWNDIALKSDGPETPAGGYNYSSMIEIWRAANATQSNVIMWWWRPDATVQEFEGTPYEFQPVVLMTPTEKCTQSRVIDFCSSDLSVRRGVKDGSCDYEANAPTKIIAASLKTNAYRVPVAKRSPGYDVVSALRVTDLAMETMFTNWISLKRDGADARKVVCKWVANNIETLDRQFIPRGYPRQVTEGSYEGAFLHAMKGVAALVAITVLLSGVVTYRWRDTRVIKYSQISFLFLILLGYLLISIGAAVTTLEPSKTACMLQPWLLMLGYALAIVPVLVKIAAINRLMAQAKKMKRVKLSKNQLYGAVALMMAIFILYLIVWTTVDPSVEVETWNLVSEGGSTVEVILQCSSSSNVWRYLAAGSIFLLLLSAAILAWQNRNVRQEFNESRSLATATYSHFIFAVLRLVIYFLPSVSIPAYNLAGVSSLLLSLDTLINLCIYFVPKFVSAAFRPQQPIAVDRAAKAGTTGATKLTGATGEVTGEIREVHRDSKGSIDEIGGMIGACKSEPFSSIQ